MSSDYRRNIAKILTEQFYSWKPFKDILTYLEACHGIKRSLSWLKIQFKKLGLSRRCPKQKQPHNDVIKHLVQNNLNGPMENMGYRAIWKLLWDKYKLIANRDTVMKIVKEIDPTGVENRKKQTLKRRKYHSKGPNHIWHLDDYDKLSPYGFKIHGCIDGFSRKILWLRIGMTNHDPKVIARYFLECVERVGGCPHVVRGDLGTENCLVASIQIALRNCLPESFIYGPSKSNIRIEAWWSQFRKSVTAWWITTCQQLVSKRQYLLRSTFHQHCLLYSCGPVFEQDVQDFVAYWNSHRIRSNKLSDSPPGIPNELYNAPELAGGEDCLHGIDSDIWLHCMTHESSAGPHLVPASSVQ